MSNDFNLESISVENKKVKVKYSDLHAVAGNASKEFGHNTSCPVVAHPDLQSLMDDLKEFLMRANGYYSVYEEAIKYLNKGEQKQKVVDEFLDLVARVKVTKLTVTTSKEKGQSGASIEGTISSINKAHNKLETPKILFEGTSLGYEGRVREIADEIELEAKLLIFKGKSMQGTLPLEEAQKEEKPKRGPGRPRKEKAEA